MSLFSRIKNTIAADVHEMLDEKEQKNPIALLNQYLRDCEKEVEKVRKLVERQYLLKEEFTKEYNDARLLADKRKYQVEVAARAGETELMNFAIQEQTHYEERASRLKLSLEQATSHLYELEQKYEEMKHKLKDMHIKRMELMGRENMTRANHRMDQMLEHNGYTGKTGSKFDEMDRYLDRLEHQANSQYHRNTIDSRIAQLEKQLKNQESHSIS
ncbi:PspA/IM30 family protein [Anaerobacillus alkaliphilus]|uniref:PspA/IM30 family protein n=1 Tax=Anaerobacillus alkaliphilus TaxID=1548597 RepID=A0A4Q0VTK3_9BACI|nr:PspA/IM30 family protein [Anaerobacillus alkaliphilus]RXJ00363.1 PspA/IM30 family protein [Anaerobacillus alkaliphilus]